MQQTISINLGGLVFHIEKDAFDQLQDYLAQIKNHLQDNESREEILQDIESRIAEMFQERLSSRKEAITQADLLAVKTALGEPAAFGTNADADQDTNQQQAKTESNKGEYTRKGRIHRDLDNKVIAGVCSGIAQYYRFDPVWLRLLFIVALLASGSGIVVYIILWIIIPPAKTPVQKMEMRGERVTVSNIEQSFTGQQNNTHSNTYQQANRASNQRQTNDFAKQGKQAVKTSLDYLEKGFVKLGQACRKATTRLEKE